LSIGFGLLITAATLALPGLIKSGPWRDIRFMMVILFKLSFALILTALISDCVWMAYTKGLFFNPSIKNISLLVLIVWMGIGLYCIQYIRSFKSSHPTKNIDVSEY